MELLEFLRRWRPSHLVIGVVVSLLLHALVIAALFEVRPSAMRKHETRRGETLIVDLPPADEKAAAGTPGAPQTVPAPKAAPPAKPAPAPPKVAPAPPAAPPKAVAKAAPAPKAEAPRAVPPAERLPAPAPDPLAAAPPKSAEPSLPPSPEGTVPAPQPALKAPEPPAGSPGAPAGGSEPGGRQLAAVPPPGPAQPFVPDIRSLRRGTGGAGGRGDSHAGIEGEPIALDSKDPKYSDYLDQVRRRIKANWSFPCVKNESTRQCDYKTTDLLVEFGIAKDGHVPFVTVRRSSGYPIYDDYAVNAIKLASPFPRIPDAFSKSGVPISATFSYIVESSLTNLLR
jgi:TonB family protein